MNIFTDYIHADLYYSLHALFEKRLGWNLYAPHGEDWQQANIFTAIFPPNSTELEHQGGILPFHIDAHQYIQKRISFATFKEMSFDILVTGYYGNESVFCQLQQNHHPSSMLIRQIANIGETPLSCKNVMLAMNTRMPKGINFIKYHPEHLDIYQPDNKEPPKIIRSLFNNFSSYPQAIAPWEKIKGSLLDFTFKVHGHNGQDGAIPQKEFYRTIQDSMFIYHPKPLGCCGFTARQALSCGKPLIVDKRYCRQFKTLAEDYLQDGFNCIDLDPAIRTVEQAIGMIREWSRPEVYQEKSLNASNTFRTLISFETEAASIKEWVLSNKI